MTPIVILVPVRTRNPQNMQSGNSRLAGILRTRAKAKIRNQAEMFVSAPLRAAAVTWPVVVTLTRLSSGHMDDDGIAAACKGVRDSVAKALGVDDGDRAKIRFLYDERKVKRGVYGVEVRVESAGMETAR